MTSTAGGAPRRASLGRFVLRRLLGIVPLLVVVSVVSFSLVHVIGGDPARTIAGDTASDEQVEAIRTELGLDRPLVTQFVDWSSGAVRGDLGTSLFSSVPVRATVLERIQVTVSLALVATLLATCLGCALALAGARRPGGAVDRLATALASIGQAVPAFWLGLVLVALFALRWTWFPATGYTPIGESFGGWARSITLPVIALAMPAVALVTRQAQAALAVALRSDHVRAARALGLGRGAIMRHYVIPTAGVTVVVQVGLIATTLLGGSLVVEQIFAMPGLGQLAVDAVARRDLPVVQGLVLATAGLVAVFNLVVDSVQAGLDPRARTR